MARYFTTYWQPDGWRNQKVGQPIRYAGGSLFKERGVVAGSRVYVVNIAGGAVRLLGAFTVDEVLDREAARRRIESPWNADQHLIAKEGSSKSFAFRSVSPDLAQLLRFRVGGSEVGLKFKSTGLVDGQTLRSVRELTPESAAMLDGLLSVASYSESSERPEASDLLQGDSIPVYTDDGQLVKARFQVWEGVGQLHVVVESRGGTIGSPNERNAQYSQGLRLIVSRLAGMGIPIDLALVESATLLKRGLTDDERQIQGIAYPLILTPASDGAEIAARLQRGQTAVGSKSESGRGNSTRRLLLKVTAEDLSAAQLTDLLALGPRAGTLPVPLGPVATTDAAEAASRSESDFSPTDLADARRRVLVALAQRQGQPQFRRKVLEAYGNQCALTKCDVLDVLEAAHIVPYWGPKTNHIQNGILLRADLHTLYDRGLFGIDPVTWTVRVSAKLKRSPYSFLDGAVLALPAEAKCWPNAEALRLQLESIDLG